MVKTTPLTEDKSRSS